MVTSRKRLGLALGGGAARGFAHIGVLRVLEEEGIPVDVIAGTSMGAFIGALYAAGVPVRHMENLAEGIDWRQMARLVAPAFGGSGITDGRKVRHFMSELLPVRNFDELRLPFAITATDIETGESVIIKKGELLPALQAAIAFPGIFTPVLFGERFLVDGGLCHPVPVDLARRLGAEIVVGVCAIPEVRKPPAEAFLPAPAQGKPPRRIFSDFLTPQKITRLLQEVLSLGRSKDFPEPDQPGVPERKPPGLLKVCAQSVAIMENEINALRMTLNRSDVLIRPQLNGISLLDFHLARESIQAGAEETRRCLGSINTLMQTG